MKQALRTQEKKTPAEKGRPRKLQLNSLRWRSPDFTTESDFLLGEQLVIRPQRGRRQATSSPKFL